ncbi:UNVERIFIED_CONTAM: Pyrophosphate-energized vacuolar membrane proton pump [Sesamum latifolium]|uniref:H(+)-exporting diphosphatase n=1 Tax=Sesamum latifolium TaxID=2727402 RepID=A0AAW2Y966_9LAMI
MEGTAKPDYANCVKISTDASIKEMIPPGALVMLTPLISVVSLVVGNSFWCSCWSPCLRCSGRCFRPCPSPRPKGSAAHKAAVIIGDTVGDPLKDTSGPSLNILIKLMAVESLVFAPFFATHGGLLFKIF